MTAATANSMSQEVGKKKVFRVLGKKKDANYIWVVHTHTHAVVYMVHDAAWYWEYYVRKYVDTKRRRRQHLLLEPPKITTKKKIDVGAN